MVEEGEEKKENNEIKVLVDYVKTLKLFKIVVIVLPAQRDGHQLVDVIQEMHVLE